MEVIILAGGLGTRLRSAVGEVPKCLAPISTKPFLAYLLQWLSQYPVKHVVFSVGYLQEQVRDFVQSRSWPFSYDFAVEESPLGTGGGIRLALSYCTQDQVFVINGDTFFPVKLSSMPFPAPVSLALKPLKDFDRYGTVQLEGNAVVSFQEKRPCAEGLINGGVYAIDRRRLDLSGLPERFSFEKEVLEPLAAKGALAGWISDSFFIDIGVPEDYQKAQWAIPAWFAVRKASKAVLATDADTLFLDRDGVLNKHLPGDYVKSWKQWEWMPGILQELPAWARKFRRIVLVTNQRGVGKGLMSEADLDTVHAAMISDIREAGGRLDLILTCTALSDNDPCRKPNPGMFFRALEQFPDIDAKRSVMLGDSPSDAAFAANCGMAFIHI